MAVARAMQRSWGAALADQLPSGEFSVRLHRPTAFRAYAVCDAQPAIRPGTLGELTRLLRDPNRG